jgi:hypothetical protein
VYDVVTTKWIWPAVEQQVLAAVTVAENLLEPRRCEICHASVLRGGLSERLRARVLLHDCFR